MSDYGVTPEGFKRKRLDFLLDELNAEVKAIFGDNFNVSPESPDGQVNGVISESNANLWEIAEEAYNAFNPSAATGNTLSNLVQLNNIERLAPTYSRVQLTLSGSTGAVIPAGSLVSTSDSGAQFATESTVTIDGLGVALVFAKALQTGPISALSGTVTKINTPISGWNSVTNASDANVGTNEETDVELRARRARSVASNSQAIIDGIYAAISNIDGVTQTIVLENDTDATDSNGLPPHSFQVIVLGGDDDEIASAIWIKKPAGIQAFGTTTIPTPDSQGILHNISFSRPTAIDIYVEVTISTYSDYPANGDDLIKQAIVDYANGDLIEGSGFSLGEDVIYTRLYTPINSIEGHEIVSLKIDIVDPPTGTSNISIAATEISNFTVANITVIS